MLVGSCTIARTTTTTANTCNGRASKIHVIFGINFLSFQRKVAGRFAPYQMRVQKQFEQLSPDDRQSQQPHDKHAAPRHHAADSGGFEQHTRLTHGGKCMCAECPKGVSRTTAVTARDVSPDRD